MSKERSVKAAEKKAAREQIAQAKAKQLQAGQSYDIICHTSKVKTERFKLKEGLPGTRVGYDIINNLAFDAKNDRSDKQLAAMQVKQVNEHLNAGHTAAPREFNVISNKYHKRHLERTALDKQTERAEAAQKFWTTHDFNPVLCSYYDPKKEQLYHKKVHSAFLFGVHGLGQQ